MRNGTCSGTASSDPAPGASAGQSDEAQRASFQPVGSETLIVLLICLLAGLRIFLFSAAFPFFDNVDEEAHLDLVCKIAGGHFPHNLEHFGKEAAYLIVSNRSPEYYQGIPEAESFRRASSVPEYWEKSRNHEATSPPVYYAVAAAWFRIGKALGLAGRGLLYWIRFLNIPIFMLVVWLAYAFGKAAFPSLWHLRLGLPLMVAFLPQDVFYSINSDVLSAPLAAGALLLLAKLRREPRRNTRFALLAGLLIAASCLTKFINLPLLAIAAIVAAGMFRGSVRADGKASRTLAVSCAALIPVALFCVRNLLVAGDLTGSAEKLQLLGWSLKPFGKIWSHPIFTLHGMSTFWHGLMGTFWRGEFFWFGSRLASGGADLFYSISSALFLGVGVVVLFSARRAGGEVKRSGIGWISVLTVLLFVGELVALSVVFDFGTCPYPSQAYPYFTSGRLMAGAIIPFFAVYLVGMDFLLRPLRRKWATFSAVLGVAAIATISEIYLSWSPFQSAFNWFHI